MFFFFFLGQKRPLHYKYERENYKNRLQWKKPHQPKAPTNKKKKENESDGNIVGASYICKGEFISPAVVKVSVESRFYFMHECFKFVLRGLWLE